MKNSAIGSNWKDVRSELFTKEEILESDMRVAIMSELIEARHKQGISQKKLEELSGVNQPVIARMETGKTSPTVGYSLESFSQFRKDISSCPTRTEKELIERGWETLTNLTVIVPQVYNIEKLCFIYIKCYIKCERSELLADISRYSGILDNNLLSRTEFLRHSGSKIRDEITK